MAGSPTVEEVTDAVLHQSSKIEEVPLRGDSPKIDRSYQRDISMRLVEEIASSWDVVASELVLLSRRGDGDLYIINGQHRCGAARRLGLPTVWARVIDLSAFDDPAAIEAGLRLKTNVRLGDRSLDRFRAQVRAGDPDSVAIVRILERFDTEINETPTNEAGINAVAAVEQLYRIDQGVLLTETLRMIRAVYGRVGGKEAGVNVLKSFAWVQIRHNDVDQERMVERLRGVGYAALDRRARTIQSTMGGALWVNYYRAMIDFYNERLSEKNKIEWRTRGAAGFERVGMRSRVGLGADPYGPQ